MKPARFDYVAPASLGEAIALLHDHAQEAKLLAGGQSLVPLMNLRLAQPSVLIDLNHVADLSYIRTDDQGRLAIGAMTRHHEVATSDLVRERCPMLSAAAARIGFPAIRHRGTLGGSLAHADPVAEMPCIALTLDAELTVIGPAGERAIPAADFFETYFTTRLATDELIREIRFPAIGPGEGWGFHESVRKAGDFATVAAAAQVRVTNGAIESAAIGLAGVSERPVRAADAERALIGQPIGVDLDQAAALTSRTVDAASDIHASDSFRRHLARVLTRRALDDALATAGGRA